jgi:hypothetical protein
VKGFFRVSLHVVTDDPETVAKAADIIARTAAGLALDGVRCYSYAGPEDEDECECEPEDDEAEAEADKDEGDES